MDGILCVDKPPEMTSFLCCSVARRLLGVKKAGHAGTLDPMATGVLPVLTGRATKILPYLPVHDKRYTAQVRLGFVSDTLDIWGEVRSTGVTAFPGRETVEARLAAFRGDILQVPPMTSALKRDGVRLYELARQGMEVARDPRKVTIHTLELLDYDREAGLLSLDCACSKGTYIRSLCDDIGRALGCGAVMAGLRRTMAAGFGLDGCLTLEEARALAAQGRLAEKLLPTEAALAPYPVLVVTAAQADRFRHGGALDLDRLRQELSGLTRLHDPAGAFIGLGEPEEGQCNVRYLADIG